jgi:hypothetical protein
MKLGETQNPAPVDRQTVAPVKPYSPPRLEVLGELRDLTFGPSPGVGDSVLPATRKVAGT